MTYQIHHIPARLAAGIFAALTALLLSLASCSDSHTAADPDEPGMPADVTPQVGFYIVVDGVADSDASRAGGPADSDLYYPGFDFEKYINLPGGDIRFLFFDPATNRLQCEFSPNGIVADPADSLSHSKRYHVLGSLPECFDPREGFSTKLMVLANWQTRGCEGAYPEFEAGVTTIKDIWDTCRFDYSPETDRIPTADCPIPFFGITDALKFTTANFTADTGFTAAFGTVHLLRALAKVEVELDAESDWEISRVWFRAYSDAGLPAAAVTSQSEYMHGRDHSLDYTSRPNLPAQSQCRDELDFVRVSSNRYVVYVPEYNNINTSAPSTIAISFEGSEFDFQEIEFANYGSDGRPATVDGKIDRIDILRNVWYRFTVRKSDETVSLDVQLDVQPYAQVTLTPSFGLERDEDGNIVVRNSKGEIIKKIDLNGNEVTYEAFTVPNIGAATGVFDEKHNVQVAILPDGRMINYIYANGNFMRSQTSLNDYDVLEDVCIRMEIYSCPDSVKSNFVTDYFLMEEFESYRYDWATDRFWPVFMDNFYDDGGTLIQRNVFNDLDHYNHRNDPGAAAPVIAVRFEGPASDPTDRYSDKTIYYYHNNNLFQVVSVKKNRRQATDNSYNPLYEYDGYLYDEETGEVLRDPVNNDRLLNYIYDEKGEKIPIWEYYYTETYTEY